MISKTELARKISQLCESRWLKSYTSIKLKTDPLYDGVFNQLEGSRLPLLDIGCGLGILAMYLRERGLDFPVKGVDYDESKIVGGRAMLKQGGYEEVMISQGDARSDLPNHQGNVTILDILQFFEEEDREAILRAAASKVAPGGKLVIRSGLQEKTVRFYVTYLADLFAKATFWMKDAPVTYPTVESFVSVLEDEGLEVEVSPFWGRTPFNNFMIVGSRVEA